MPMDSNLHGGSSDGKAAAIHNENKNIKIQLLKLKRERLALRREKKNWSVVEKKLSLAQLDNGDVIKLNVGGQIYATSLATLTKIPDTFFSYMFSGRWTLKCGDDGTFFINRDSTTFPFLLNFMREYPESTSYPQMIIHLSALHKSMLNDDAEFYNVGPLMLLLQPPLVHSDYIMHWGFNMFQNSILGVLMTDSQRDKLCGWIPGGFNAEPSMLYRSDKDDRELSRFHECCAGKGRSILLVRTKRGHIFGAFAGCSWETSKNWVGEEGSVNSFIFTISNPHGIEMTKFRFAKKEQLDFRFGSSNMRINFGHDIHISPSKYTVGFKFPIHYEDTSGIGRRLFTGKKQSPIDFYEVWKV